MRSIGTLCLLLATLALPATGVETKSVAPIRTLLRASRLLDVKAGRYVAGGAVLVEGRRIAAASTFADVRARAPRNVEIVDLGDVTLLPGLIDCHAHILGNLEDFSPTKASSAV